MGSQWSLFFPGAVVSGGGEVPRERALQQFSFFEEEEVG